MEDAKFFWKHSFTPTFGWLIRPRPPVLSAPGPKVPKMTSRRFPPPWRVESLDGGFKVVDSNGQTLAYVYGHADARDAAIAKALTLDEARRVAANIAKLPALLAKRD